MEKENVEYISLDVLVEGLPESLRSQFKEIASGYGIGKRWTIATITKYLVGLGYRDVSFRKHLTMPDGLRFYVDVYCGDENLYVFCLDAYAGWIKSRVSMVKRAYAGAKVAVAIPDWLVWSLLELEGVADLVLAVGRDGMVLGIGEWVDRRQKMLEEAALNVACELMGLQQYYERISGDYEEIRSGRYGLCNYISAQLMGLANTIGVKNFGWLSGREYQTESDSLLNGLWREMNLVRDEMLKIFVEFANKLLATYTPYTLTVTEKGKLLLYRSLEAEQWLGWTGSLDPTRSLAIQKEIALIAKTLENAQKEGKIAPKRIYNILHFSTHKGEWPSQTIMVPKAVLEGFMKRIERIEEILKKIEEAKRLDRPE